MKTMRSIVTANVAPWSSRGLAVGCGGVAWAIGLVAFPTPSWAGNAHEFFVGDRAAMAGGAVTATVEDGSAAFYNPAGLARVKQSRLDVGATAYGLRLVHVENYLQVEDGPGKDVDYTEFVAVPTQVAYTRKLGENANIALGYFVPKATDMLLSERLNADTGSPSTWALDGRLTGSSSWLTASLGLSLSERIRVGFTLFGGYTKGLQALSFLGAVEGEGEGTTSKTLAITSLSQSTQIALALGLGTQIDVTPELTVGLAARGPEFAVIQSVKDSRNYVEAMFESESEPLLYTESGQLEESRKPAFVSAGAYSAALAYEFGEITASAEAEVVPGFRYEQGGVDTKLIVNGRAGVIWALAPDVNLGAGLFTDRSGEVVASAGQIDYYGGTLGVELENLLDLAESERSDSLKMKSVFALRYAYGSGPYEQGRFNPDADADSLVDFGTADFSAHEMAFHIGSAFQF